MASHRLQALHTDTCSKACRRVSVKAGVGGHDRAFRPRAHCWHYADGDGTGKRSTRNRSEGISRSVGRRRHRDQRTAGDIKPGNKPLRRRRLTVPWCAVELSCPLGGGFERAPRQCCHATRRQRMKNFHASYAVGEGDSVPQQQPHLESIGEPPPIGDGIRWQPELAPIGRRL